MILIRASVGPSQIHGMGLFASQFIPRGTPVWQFEPGFDRGFSLEEVDRMPPRAQEHIRWYAYLDGETGQFVLSGDHACFMNHDPDPNTGVLGETTTRVVTRALRDIPEGAELTCNYHDFDVDAARKLA